MDGMGYDLQFIYVQDVIRKKMFDDNCCWFYCKIDDLFITWMNCWNRIVGQVLLDQQLEYEFEISG